LHSGLPVICCDGAANRFVAEGGTPTAIIGDGDSLSEEVREKCAHLIHQVAEQETNDLTKSVAYVKSQGAREICILGATGLRECHTLGNISLLIEYMRWGVDVRMFTDHGVFIPCSGHSAFSCRPRQQVSVFSFGAKGFSAEGLVYPLHDFTNWWQGTLNECTAEKFAVDAEGEYLVFLNFLL
jgi:thiamine pyrophosphokinase